MTSSLPENWVVILIGWLSNHSCNYAYLWEIQWDCCLIFQRITSLVCLYGDNLYHKQQIALVFETEMLYWTANEESLWRVSSNILIIFLVNSKIALVFETETLNWTANEESLQRVSRFFIWSPRVFGSDFLFMRSFWHQCCNSTFYTQMLRHSHEKTTFLASNHSWSQVCEI